MMNAINEWKKFKLRVGFCLKEKIIPKTNKICFKRLKNR